ncbi:MAG: NAD(P)H-hydrate dehydratase [Simkaniaceae bacterium]|nr:NAD(P)H-hydrate dehydratase [Simkaniaceae bacterium]
MQLEGQKVVEAKEMARMERESIQKGASDEGYMFKAGEGIAQRIEAFIEEKGRAKKVTLLAGKGNNGGDAFVAGTFLIHRGFEVQAYHLAEAVDCRPLCRKYEKIFAGAGGTVVRGTVVPLEGVIVDGLLGTGVQGILEGSIRDVIHQVNNSRLPILSIDIPSGLNGNTGEVNPNAIYATETMYLGLPKLGFFIGQGYNYIGKLFHVDFGMDPKYWAKAQGNAYIVNEDVMPSLLPPIQRVRHKYQAGYVLALAGSPGMPGAAILSSLAALRSGAGIVRLFHPEEMEDKFAAAPLELVRTSYSLEDPSPIFEEAKRAQACLIGPGLGKSEGIHTSIQAIVSKLNLPMVIDADGLYHIEVFPRGAILTPHYKEMLHLLGKEELSHDDCQKFADQNAVTIVLKGAPTWIFHPNTAPLIVPKGDPGMATAGTGDVLTGMIAATLAQGLDGKEAATLGVYLHGICGEIVAAKQTSYGLIASDLIKILPEAFQTLLAQLSHE